jgi:hypothetical protein
MGVQQAMLMVNEAAVGPLSASISPSDLIGLRSGSGSVTTTEAATCTASGGSESGYTYSWSRVSGSTDITANSGSSATTDFSATLTAPDEVTAVFKCTVDDSLGNGPVDSTNTVSITLTAD